MHGGAIDGDYLVARNLNEPWLAFRLTHSALSGNFVGYTAATDHVNTLA